jgi:hypothetical protein
MIRGRCVEPVGHSRGYTAAVCASREGETLIIVKGRQLIMASNIGSGGGEVNGRAKAAADTS